MFKKIFALIILLSIFAFCDHAWHWHDAPGAVREVKNDPPTVPDVNKDPTPDADPIDMFSGAYLYQNRDLFIPGHISLSITRNYSSQRYYNSPYGFAWTINYDMRITEFPDEKILLRDQNGHRRMFTLQGGSYTPPEDLNAYLNKTDTSYIYKEKHGTQYIFDTLGYLITIIDRNGNKLTLTYTAEPESIMGVHPYSDFFGVVARRHLITQVSDDFGRALEFYYDDNGRIDSITGPANYKIDYTINDQGDLTKVIEDANELAITTEYTYNVNHCLTHIKNPAEEEYLSMEYDSLFRVTDQTYGSGEFEVTYNDEDSITTLTDPMNNISTYAFNDKKLPKWIANHYADTTKYEYTDNYDLEKITDPRGYETNFTYDFGNLLTITDALNKTTTLRYTADFHLIDSIVDPDDNTTKFRYDSYGNLDTIINAAGKKTELEYDAKGNLIKITDPEGNVINYSYKVSDGLRHNSTLYGSETYDSLYPTKIWAIVDSREIAIKFDYDYRRGLRVAVGDPNDNITYYDYNSSNRLIKVYNSDNPPNSGHTSTPSMEYTYDVKGNLTRKDNYYGHFIEFEYDTLNLLREVKEHLDDSTFITKYSYDLSGNLITFENALEYKTEYRYDALSRLIKVMYPDSTSGDTTNNPYYTYLYNNPNDPINLYKRIDANANTTTYFYDALNRLDSLGYPDGNCVTYEYHDDYTLKELTDSTGTIKFMYNAVHQIDSTSYPNNNGLKLSYYDNGLRKREKFNNGTHDIEYEYDALNRLKKVCDNVTDRDIIYTYDYNASTSYTSLGNLVKITYPNNIITEYEYLSCCNRIGAITTKKPMSAPIQSFEYEYDLIGNITETTLEDGSYIEYHYDDLNRLTQAEKRNAFNALVWDRKYYYDRVGNIQKREWANQEEKKTYYYSYLTGTNLLHKARGYTYRYDENGNPYTCDDGRDFEYDYENRLIQVTRPDVQTDFYYNGFGDRIAKTHEVDERGRSKGRTEPETYDDLTYKNPMGDSLHDPARDIGDIHFTYDQNSVSIEIAHKYLYGSNQGQYENIYIALDIDGVYLSGNLDLPDTMMTKVSPAAAWEFCIYVYDQDNYGFYDKKGRKHHTPSGMKVIYSGVGADEKLIIELPRRIAARIDKIRFTVATTKPGFVNPDTLNNMMSRATDVFPGGNEALINHAEIGSYAEMLLEPGRSRGTTEYKYVYDDFGRQIYEKKTVDTRQYLTYYTYGYGMETRRTGTGISQLRYLHKDILGSVTAVSDDYGRVSTELEYSPFGELISGSAASLGNFAFTGQEWDNDITMYHFPARYYEPLWGRFMTPDPYTNLPDDARNFMHPSYTMRNSQFYSSSGIPQLLSNLHTKADGSKPTMFSRFMFRTTSHENNSFSKLIPLLQHYYYGFYSLYVPQKLNFYVYTVNNPSNLTDLFGLAATCAEIAMCVQSECEAETKKHNKRLKPAERRKWCKIWADAYEELCNQNPLNPPQTNYPFCDMLFGLDPNMAGADGLVK